MESKNKFIGYARDDIFIISVNRSADRIEECESRLYINHEDIFIYYALISALYSKTHSYIDTKLKERLSKIKVKLYTESFIEDIKHRKINPKTRRDFEWVLTNLNNIYCIMTRDFSKSGIFPKTQVKDTRPGAVK